MSINYELLVKQRDDLDAMLRKYGGPEDISIESIVSLLDYLILEGEGANINAITSSNSVANGADEVNRPLPVMHSLRKLIEERKLEDAGHLPSKYSIAVHIWARDCDQMEVSYVQIMPATVQHYLKAERELYDNAEGPCSMHIMTEEEYNEFEPYRRDRRAEQYNY
tara:strand:+ start:3003 stop:3500 length:498 start_codon:yes stop_codon:yes gene_type:complete